jgi:hypothetical protein
MKTPPIIVSRGTLPPRKTCFCGDYRLYRDSYCFSCYMLYRRNMMNVQGIWYNVHTSGAKDALILPVLRWEIEGPVTNYAIKEKE